MIIEFYGLPGSGKTTIAKNLSQKTDFRIIKIRKKGDLFFYNLLFLVKHPIFSLKSFFYVLKNSSSMKEFYYKFMNFFLDYNAKYEKALKNKNSILDQSFFQNIISLFNHPASDKEIKKYLNFVPKPNILFIFQLNKEDRIKRMEERGSGARDKLDFVDTKWFDSMENNNDTFIKSLSSLGVKCVVLDCEKSESILTDGILSNLNGEKDAL